MMLLGFSFKLLGVTNLIEISVCKKTMLAIRSIGRIKKYLSRDDLARLVNAYVTPHLDFCNGVLVGLRIR